jgi:antitoxin (DNA-binding transcriptional repressor) of toxin-antitoxin stability system
MTMNARADQIEQDVGDEGDDDFEIEVVDDVPADEKPRRPADAPAEIPEDDDLEGYSEQVQKRLKKLTFEAKEAARQQAEAIRLREEAINYAKTLAEQNKKLQEDIQKSQGFVVDQAKGRLEAEIEKAKIAYKNAYEAGDADALLDAQAKLTRLQNDHYRWDTFKPPARQMAEPNASAIQPQPQPQPQVKLSPNQERWLSNNDWYGKDRRMTSFALGVHEELVYNGVEPDSEKYYAEIDREMRKTFPDRFSDGEEVEVNARQRKPAAVVAPAARSAKTPRKIRLTSTQVAIAKRLGLTNEQYAAQLLKEQHNG